MSISEIADDMSKKLYELLMVSAIILSSFSIISDYKKDECNEIINDNWQKLNNAASEVANVYVFALTNYILILADLETRSSYRSSYEISSYKTLFNRSQERIFEQVNNYSSTSETILEEYSALDDARRRYSFAASIAITFSLIFNILAFIVVVRMKE